jgi:DNA-binding MarR family transcriptional regulator
MSQKEVLRREPRVSNLHDRIKAELPDEDPVVVDLILWLARLSRLVEQVDNRVRSDVGDLDASESAVLASLLFAGPPYQTSPSRLSQTIIQTTGGMAKTLRRLEQKRLIARKPTPEDGRALHVVLTPKGQRLIRKTLAAMVSTWTQILTSDDAPTRDALLDSVLTLVSMLDSPSET